MKPRLAQIQASTTAGDVATTVLVSGVLTAVWQAPASVPSMLFSDDGTGTPLAAQDGSDYLYQG